MLGRIREAVAHSSPAVREIFGLASYWLPPQIRLGSEFFTASEGIKRSREDKAWAEQEQRALLRQVIEKALKTGYYSRHQGYVYSNNEDVYELISSFPILSREELTTNRDLMLASPRAKVDLVSTSGSSGKPAVFYLDKIRGAGEWAYVCDAWRRSGYRPEDWRAVLRGQKLGAAGRRHLVSRSTRELFLSPFGLDSASVQEYWRLISARGIEYIHGYPSSLTAVAKAAQTLDPLKHRQRIKGIFPVSERVTKDQAEVLAEAFPQAVILPFYGLSERVAFAEYDPTTGNYTFSPLYGYVEVVDETGAPVDIGDEGRLVATGLRLTGMPILRYDTGDVATLAGYAGRGAPIVNGLKARRIQEHLFTGSGAAISTSALNLHSDAYVRVLAFRFVQRTYGLVDILIVLNDNGSQADAQSFASEMQQNCAGRILFNAVVVDNLPDTTNGKQQLVEMRISANPERS
ncbi:phenylacetate-CoA ligase [Arthrobacter ginsengisoli]|uniref:Phenylacetate-CoA ligase n=1 Tax=Arthrobacter ginsengisoli TaxID=1356565 RepID=A0ABU1UDG0_9MICC|nr:hypothetical protein [Arthrobacter ginsengisoli]MDR7083183.1 phenylacetate-CoA ligase [Arthrobacter ginsengisoli]